MTNSNVIEFPRSIHVCPSCESRNVRCEETIEEFEYGEGVDHVALTATVKRCSCGSCGLIYDDDTADQRRHDAICKHLGLLNPQEIRQIRKRYGSRAEFAVISRIGEASIGRWESGTQMQSAAMDVLLRLLGAPEVEGRVRFLLANREKRSLATSDRFRNIDVSDVLVAEARAFIL